MRLILVRKTNALSATDFSSQKIIVIALYFHIPFCHKACHYCDFHFSTNLRRKDEMTEAMCRELALRKDFFGHRKKLESVYFGGGTPSILNESDLQKIFEQTRLFFDIASDAEITLEANPEDVTPEKLDLWKSFGINRLSIGLQTLREPLLRLLNRNHTAREALASVSLAQKFGFENITVDFIYGIPDLTAEEFAEDLKKIIAAGISHISAYCLTVEAGTALQRYVLTGKINMPDEEIVVRQFELMTKILKENDFRHYEISNFGKEHFYSRHNQNYWKKGAYLGIGPSAHGYDGKIRYANVANNYTYVSALAENKLPESIEILTRKDHINEYILTSLRTEEGIDAEFLNREYDFDLFGNFSKEIESNIKAGNIVLSGKKILLTEAGKLFADAVAADFFWLED